MSGKGDPVETLSIISEKSHAELSSDKQLEDDPSYISKVRSDLHESNISVDNIEKKELIKVEHREREEPEVVTLDEVNNNKRYRDRETYGDFKIVRGGYHQGSIHKFKADSVGRQCTANAAVAIVMCSLKDPHLLTKSNIETVLQIGDKVYRKSIETRPKVSRDEVNHMYLNALELTKEISVGSSKRKIFIETASVGHLFEERLGCLNLEDRLHTFLEADRAGILTANSISIAIGRQNGRFWMFDSHGRNSEGKFCESGDASACLTMFKDVTSLFELIKFNIPHVIDTDNSKNFFELHPVRVAFPIRNNIEENGIFISSNAILHRKQKKKIVSTQIYANKQEPENEVNDTNYLTKSASEGTFKNSPRQTKKYLRDESKQNLEDFNEVSSSEEDFTSHKSSDDTNTSNDASNLELTSSDSSEYEDSLREVENNHSSQCTKDKKSNEECNENSNCLNPENEESFTDDSINVKGLLESEERNRNKNRWKKAETIDTTEIVLVNFSKVWDQLTFELATHKPDCSIQNVKVHHQKREGNRICFEYKCTECIWSANIWTTTNDDKTLEINEALVLGGINSGTSYTQMKKLFSAAGIRFMNNKRYRSCRDNAYKILWDSIRESMKKAGKEELEMALADGNEKDGKGLITVLADGSWMKRSYKTGSFNSPAGLVYIIGQRTGKILWLEVKDMYCSICDRANRRNTKPMKHECYKNWSREDSSSSMESVSIAEGFQKSIEEHNLIYSTLIADGDSSVFKRIRDIDPYGEYDIEVKKVECSKHLRRAFKNRIKEIVTSKRGRIGRPRQIVLASAKKCITELNNILQHYWQEEREITEELCAELSAAIDIIPRHVFGDHENCSAGHPLCNGAAESDEANQVPLLEQWDFVHEVEEAISRLSRHAESLLLNYDTNLLESAYAIVAEKIGGKRINFALRNEYHVRIMAAALQFNTRKVITTYYEKAGKETPKIAKNVEEESLKYHESRKSKPVQRRNRRKRRTYGDKDYGPNCQQVDMDSKTYATQLAKVEEKEKETMQNCDNIEKETRRQEKCSKWHRLRKVFITGTHCHKICRKREHTSCHTIVKDIRRPMDKKSAAISWGNRNEPIARKKLVEVLNCSIEDNGLFVHRSIPGLAATPDGCLSQRNEIIEIKCPFSAVSDQTLTQAYLRRVNPITRLFTDESCTAIRKSHEYYYQVQMQLNVSEKSTCHFMVWIPTDFRVILIKKDVEFWNAEMKPKLVLFYETCLKPEIVDSRLARGMKVKDPPHILDARIKHEDAKKEMEKMKEIRKNRKLLKNDCINNNKDKVMHGRLEERLEDVETNYNETEDTHEEKVKYYPTHSSETKKSFEINELQTRGNIRERKKPKWLEDYLLED